MKALVLLSGGIDSSTCLAIAQTECEEVKTITAQYGQKHSKRESQAAYEVAGFLGLRRGDIFDLPIETSIFGHTSTLMSDKPSPHLTYEELRESEGPSPTYVPFRNGNLLSAATSMALNLECNYVYFGAHADDAHNWAYPDCTPEFIGAMATAIYIGTYHEVRLRTPLMWMSKAQIILQAFDLQVPLHLTYSCYEGGEYHCGLCPTCVNRYQAFQDAGIEDPTKWVK